MWSATCLKNGKYPDKRHDGSTWLKTDKESRCKDACLQKAFCVRLELIGIGSTSSYNCQLSTQSLVCVGCATAHMKTSKHKMLRKELA